MKFRNSFEGRAQLRRQEFNRSQTKSQIKGKKSLSKRIIAERVDGLTASNIEKQCNLLACAIKSDEVLAQIMYHIKFGMDAYPLSFNEEMIEGVVNVLTRLKTRLNSGDIDDEQYLDKLEEVDKQITDGINTLSQCKEYDFDLSTK